MMTDRHTQQIIFMELTGTITAWLLQTDICFKQLLNQLMVIFLNQLPPSDMNDKGYRAKIWRQLTTHFAVFVLKNSKGMLWGPF